MIRRAVGLLALVTIYFAAGKLGLQLAFANENASAVWPASGIAVACLLMFGRGLWPAIAVGAFLVNVTIAGYIGSSVFVAAGNTLEALTAWWLVSRWAGGTAAFDRANTIFRFALFAMMAALIAATIGTASVVVAGTAAQGDWVGVWITWWLGDAVGIALVAPLIVMWSQRARARWTIVRACEMAGVIVVVAVTSWLVFGDSPAGIKRYPIVFVAMPVLLWPAFRLGARETVAATTLLSAIAVLGTLNDLGPFVGSSPNESLLFLQSFVGVWIVAMLAVSAEVETREAVEADMRALNETLERRVIARTEEANRMHERLAQAQRVANVGSWEWDIVKNTIWWSDELFRIFGQAPVAERTYENYLTLLHDDDRVYAESVVGKALADGRPFSFEHRLVRPDGSERTIQADGHTIKDASGAPIRMVGTGRDVTDLRRAEEERIERIREQAARREAEDANRAKDEFLATLSHELRTPLNAALGWTQMLREAMTMRWRRTRARARRDHAQPAGTGAAGLRHDGRLAHHAAHAAVGGGAGHMVIVVRGALDSVRDRRPIGTDAVTTMPPSGSCYVLGDDGRLQQVVWNLISNAAKFSREGGTVSVRLCEKEETVQLTVEDDGPGIAPEFLPHLFERFRQADSSVTRAHGGLGLGLAIARHLVEAHAGTIVAANRPEGGAIFTVTLPLAPADIGAT